MRINLQEIPDEGLELILTQKDHSLTKVLKDLIFDKSYTAKVFIKPTMQNAYELSGSIKTHLPEACSRCGLDFEFPIEATFKEILMPENKDPRNSHYSKPNHFSDLGTESFSVVDYRGHHFELGEYLHEVIALQEPYTPAPPVGKDDNCSLCLLNVKTHNFSYTESLPEEKASPFAALKGLKLN